MERRPLVVINGRVQELPLTDSLPGVVSEEEMVYTKRLDFVTEDEFYKGEAAVGSPESSSVWRIRKTVISSDGDVSETWASSNSNFDKSWLLRATYTYS